MATWMVRAGRGGEDADEFLASGVVAVGEGNPGVYRFEYVDPATSRADLLRLYAVKHSEMPPGAHAIWATEFYRFISQMKVGDAVITPDQQHRPFRYLRGTITSEYAWDGRRRRHPHYRRVKWTHEVLRKPLHDNTRRVLDDRHAVIPLPEDVARALEYWRRPL